MTRVDFEFLTLLPPQLSCTGVTDIHGHSLFIRDWRWNQGFMPPHNHSSYPATAQPGSCPVSSCHTQHLRHSLALQQGLVNMLCESVGMGEGKWAKAEQCPLSWNREEGTLSMAATAVHPTWPWATSKANPSFTWANQRLTEGSHSH